MHPDFPIVSGQYQMTANSFINLPFEFNRRIEDGSLVLWRTDPRITLWISVWNIPANSSPKDQLTAYKSDISDSAYDVTLEEDRISYLLNENSPIASFNGFVVSSNEFLQIGIYVDEEKMLEIAMEIFKSIELT